MNYFCLNCSKIHQNDKNAKIFSTAFYQMTTEKLNVGYCNADAECQAQQVENATVGSKISTAC